MTYLDNAATSFPKPESVYGAVTKALREECGNPGRSGHKLSLAAGKIVQDARMMCKRLFNAASPDNIVFTANATTALNIGIKGVVRPGDHVITSSFEHNSVSRPLSHLEETGVAVTKLPMDLDCGLSIEDIERAMRPETRMVLCTHISNVTGTENDISSIGAFCRDNGIVFFVDAAQSAGCRVIDVRDMCLDMLAFPGHKGLFGLQGTGGLYIKPGLDVGVFIQGGTGSKSESLNQPEDMPGKFEAGTQNVPGLAGLAAGIRFVLETGVEKICRHEAMLATRLIEGLLRISSIKIFGPGLVHNRSSIVSLRIENSSTSDTALMLDAGFNIAVRSGLHCSADAHRSLGTLDTGGTIRISPNYYNTAEDIDICLNALEICANEAG